jgi:2-keto-4-pentenoate hydratase/2-oxohepta-3-ene-1,7-dioic acid hydratase in catechol pathway
VHAANVDLTEHAPRAAREMAGGLVLLPRTIDKMRAKLAGTLGPYKIGPGLSAYLLEALGVSEAEFAEAVRRSPDDEGVIAWLHARTDVSGYAAINEQFRARGLRDAAHRRTITARYPVLRERPDLTTWFDILDADDRWIYERAAGYGGMGARFAMFSVGDDVPRPGVLIGDAIRPLPESLSSLTAFIALDYEGRREAVALAGDPLDVALVILHAPLRPAKNVFCVGRNYLAHVEEAARARGAAVDLPAKPAFFTKAPTAIADPGAELAFPAVSEQFDWEAEIAVVIGKRCRDVDELDAMDVVFGYTCLNDLTARDLQSAHQQWFKGKSLDETCPIGPWIVPELAIGDPQSLDLSCTVNGVVKQAGNTQQMIFPIARIISELSRGMTLEPGDVIATGTPEGVGFARKPPEFLCDGDEVAVYVEKIGTLRNRVRVAVPVY